MTKTYLKPETQTTNIRLSSTLLVGSPTGGGGPNNGPSIHTDIPTDDQW